MTENKLIEFAPIFYPQTHVVIGASASPFKFGGRFLRTLINFGPQGKLMVVNPQETEIAGLETYASVKDLPDAVDLASIVVPAHAVPAIVEECLARGIKGVQILSSGFSEAGEISKQWEKDIAATAARGIRVIGPNCFGIYSPEGGLTILPGEALPRESGPLAFFSQSGGLAIRVPRRATGLGLRFSQVVSFGNASDVNECDLLEYFYQDPKTEIIGCYLEGVKNGPRFFNLLKEVTRRKPVIIWKGGLTESGSRAVQSHTASLGGELSAWNALFRQTGAVGVTNIDELLDTLLALADLPPQTGRRVCVIGGGGAVGVAASDACERVGLKVSPFSPELHARLKKMVPEAGGSARNPVDIGNPFPETQMLKGVMENVARSGEVDALIVDGLELAVERNRDPGNKDFVDTTGRDNVQAIIDLKKMAGSTIKSIMVVMAVESTGSDAVELEAARRLVRDKFLQQGIPVYLTLEGAVSSLSRVTGYYRYLER